MTERPPHHARRTDLLGTTIVVTIDADDDPAVIDTTFDEITRLHSVFNWYDPTSELRRWARGETAAGVELARVMALADEWKIASSGAFDPGAGRFMKSWTSHTDTVDLDTTGRLSAPTLNAIAKGWIVDRAVDAGLRMNPLRLTVDAGGDVRHEGPGPLRIGVENPRRPYDNAKPMFVLALSRGAIATSGSSRRPVSDGDAQHSHIVDARTGRPVDHILSATVIAPDAATADVMATILTILDPESSQHLAEDRGLDWCTIDRDGVVRHSPTWNGLLIEA